MSVILSAGISYAAPINYGDFFGIPLIYMDVTEAAGSPGDTEPLFGAPIRTGDTLAFPSIHTHGFSAVAQGSGANSDTTIGTLSFRLLNPFVGGDPIESITITESGDWGYSGAGGTTGTVAASMSVFVYADAARTQLLSSINASDGEFFSGPLITGGNWSISRTIDLASFEAPEVYVVINNNLQAAASGGATAFIHKKQFFIDTVMAPEPTAAMVLGLGAMALALRRPCHRAA